MVWNPEGSVVLEVLPPTLKSGLEGLHRRLSRVRRLIENGDFDAVNIPEIHDEENRNDRGHRRHEYSARMQPRELGRRIQDELGIPAIVNHVVSFDPADQLLDWVNETVQGHDIHNLVLVGAPHDRRQWPGPAVGEANQLIRQQFGSGEVCIGNICIPQREDSPISEAVRMEQKAQDGADFFSTQIIFDAADIISLLSDLQDQAPNACGVPLLVSLCPVKRFRQLGFLRYLGVRVPDHLDSLLATVPEADCLDLSLEILSDIQGTLLDHQQQHQSGPLLGWNIAPVGPIPIAAIETLMDRLPGSIRS